MSKEANMGLLVGGERGYVVLKRLIEQGFKIGAVLILKQDSHELQNFEKKMIALCDQSQIAWQTSNKVAPKEYKGFLENKGLDIVFVVSWRYLIPSDCFHIPRRGMYVVHDSLLPLNRGFAPTNWAIIRGEEETGLTLFKIAQAVDAGDIVAQIKVRIEDKETATSLNQKFLVLYPKIIEDNIEGIAAGTAILEKQKEDAATYLKKRKPADGKIDFKDSAKNIERLIRGLSYPYPGAFFEYAGKNFIVWEAVTRDSQSQGSVGEVLEVAENFLEIQTQEGVLRVLKMASEDSPEDMQLPINFINQKKCVLT